MDIEEEREFNMQRKKDIRKSILRSRKEVRPPNIIRDLPVERDKRRQVKDLIK